MMEEKKYFITAEQVRVNLKGKKLEEDYDIVAIARGHKVLYFERFGQYQGEWVMLSKLKNTYFIWHDWFGSCSGCDYLQSVEPFNWQPDGVRVTDYELMARFVNNYSPFAEISRKVALSLSKKHELLEVCPANIRDWYEVPRDKVANRMEKIILQERE